MTRWLVIADYLDPELPGGSARVAWETARALAARGHDVRLAAGRARACPPACEGGLRADWFVWPGVLGLPGRVRTAVARLLGDGPPDVVLAHQPLSAALALGLPALRGVPLLYVFHSPWHLEYEWNRGRDRWSSWLGSWVRRAIERRVVGRAARIFTLSEAMAREASAAHPGLDPTRLARLPGGVDPGRFRPGPRDPAVRRELGIPEDAVLVLSARRLVPRTGLVPLVEAFARLAQDIPAAFLAIAGSGPAEESVRAVIARHGLGRRVVLSGALPEARLPAVLREADLFVMPSQGLEGLGLALLEAMACGVAVLGTPVGGMAELLRAFDGRCLTAGTDPAELERGLRRFLIAPDLRTEIGIRAAAFARAGRAWENGARALEAAILGLPPKGP